MQTPEALERIAAELAEDNQAEGVRYLEVRFAPQLHVRPGLDGIQVLAAVDRGLRRARDAFKSRAEIAAGPEVGRADVGTPVTVKGGMRCRGCREVEVD